MFCLQCVGSRLFSIKKEDFNSFLLSFSNSRHKEFADEKFYVKKNGHVIQAYKSSLELLSRYYAKDFWVRMSRVRQRYMSGNKTVSSLLDEPFKR